MDIEKYSFTHTINSIRLLEVSNISKARNSDPKINYSIEPTSIIDLQTD